MTYGSRLQTAMNDAKVDRKTLAKKLSFQRTHPCPVTGQARGACPGYVVDHIVPLCAGGADSPANMQWQTVEDGKAKDRLEMQECRSVR